MTDGQRVHLADDMDNVRAIYKNKAVADSYLDKGLQFSCEWLLHEIQPAAMKRAIETTRPGTLMELAPGPARLSVLLEEVKRGVMAENSEEMIEIARRRLRSAGSRPLGT
jgi:hypothetical protein